MPTFVPIEKAGSTLPELAKRVRRGEDIVLTEAGRPVFRLIKADAEEPDSRSERPVGLLDGKIKFRDDAFDPLPQEFWGEAE
jgi:prevent-host-death family protein